MTIRLRALCLIVLAAAVGAGAQPVTAPPPELAREWQVDPFYRKYLDDHGLPVLSSPRASDCALREAACIIDSMLAGRDDLRQALIRAHMRCAVMAPTEMTTVVPEHRDLTPARYWDYRARGLGGTPERLAVSCAEENLLGYRGDPYTGQSILVHEFAHTIQGVALRAVDPTFWPRLQAAYRNAVQRARWQTTYAGTNAEEYWACGVQAWFGAAPAPDWYHNEVNTREKLRMYDPELAALLREVFRGNDWRYVPPWRRPDRGHLRGCDPAAAPRFQWDPALVDWNRRYEQEAAGQPK